MGTVHTASAGECRSLETVSVLQTKQNGNAQTNVNLRAASVTSDQLQRETAERVMGRAGVTEPGGGWGVRGGGSLETLYQCRT